MPRYLLLPASLRRRVHGARVHAEAGACRVRATACVAHVAVLAVVRVQLDVRAQVVGERRAVAARATPVERAAGGVRAAAVEHVRAHAVTVV